MSCLTIFINIVILLRVSSLETKLKEILEPSSEILKKENKTAGWKFLRGTAYYENDTIDLKKVNWNAFEKITTIRLKLTGFKPVHINSKAFPQNNKIEELDLDIPILRFSPGAFKNLKKLKYLSIAYQEGFQKSIEDGKEIFQGLQNLKTLTIISYVQSLDFMQSPKFFSPFPGLEELALIAPKIVIDPKSSIFRFFKYLSSLSLYGELVHGYPDSLIGGSKSLKELILIDESFSLKRVGEEILANLPNLEELEFVCKLSSVPKDLLKHNRKLKRLKLQVLLHEIPEGFFSNTKEILAIDLSGNFIWKLNKFTFVKNIFLSFLNLAKNPIENKEDIQFFGPENLKVIGLR